MNPPRHFHFQSNLAKEGRRIAEERHFKTVKIIKIFMMFLKEILLLSFLLCLVWTEQFGFYSLSATDINSLDSIEMSKFKGKVCKCQ